jgi:Ca2+-binding EF-hand superfamily protein
MVNTGYRLSATNALKHPWIEKAIAKKNLPNELVVSFDLFRMAPCLKRIALNALAQKSSPSTYSSIWNALDSTESGTLTRKEFIEGFKNTGHSSEELTDLFKKLDVNCNDEILYTEFLAATLENDRELEEAEIRQAFDLLSKNQKYITKKDVQRVMGAKRKKQTGQARLKADIDEIFQKCDKFGYESFAQLFEHGYIHQSGMDAIIETSLNEEQLSQLRDDEKIAHMATIKEGY